MEDQLDSALARMERDHPNWKVGPTEVGQWWEAVAHPTSTSTHVAVCRSLPELALRLDEIEPPS